LVFVLARFAQAGELIVNHIYLFSSFGDLAAKIPPMICDSLSTDQKIRERGLYHDESPKNSEIDRTARIVGNPEQRHDQLTKIRADCRVFYIEFAVVKNFLQVGKLVPALPNFSAQLFLFRIWGDIFCGSFNLGTKLIRVKHQFG
jgi:hypothetical protein